MIEVVVTTGAIRRAKLQSNCHQQQTNTQLFTGRMPFLSPSQQCQSTKGNGLARCPSLLIRKLRIIQNTRTTDCHQLSLPLISVFLVQPAFFQE